MAPGLQAQATRIAKQYGLPPAVFHSLIQHESGWQPAAVSPAGAIGLTQLMPKTAAGLGIDPHDPIQNMEGGARYLRAQLDSFGSMRLALAAYNAGPGAVHQYGGVPPYHETEAYVRAILGRAGGGQTQVPGASAAAPPADLAGYAFGNLSAIAGGSYSPQHALSNLVDDVSRRSSKGAMPMGAKTAAFNIGSPIAKGFQTSVGGEHQTSGLAGYPAHDYFAKAGSQVVAPVAGTIIRLSGTDPAAGPSHGPHGPFGLSLYLHGTDGRTYYLTHMGALGVKVGQKVKPGSVLGTVGDYARYGTPSHIHMGVH